MHCIIVWRAHNRTRCVLSSVRGIGLSSVEFQLRKKYTTDGEFFLFDEGDEDDGTTYKDHRKISNLGWVNCKGWELGTVLVSAEDNRTKTAATLSTPVCRS